MPRLDATLMAVSAALAAHGVEEHVVREVLSGLRVQLEQVLREPFPLTRAALDELHKVVSEDGAADAALPD